MFLTCSRTLDFASTIEMLDALVAAVERARVRVTALLPFVALGMRILAAERDMVYVL